ncbi:MAG: DUF4118 domain-containing protein [Spirochaetales bacterium]|nr:DUF4118 domain-containing protein [Spirochaetales bacterium]
MKKTVSSGFTEIFSGFEGRAVSGEESSRVLAAIGPGPGSSGVLRVAADLATKMNLSLAVVYVDNGKKMSEASQRELLSNFRLSRALGAQVFTTADSDPVAGIHRVASQIKAKHLVIGKSRGISIATLYHGGSVTSRLLRKNLTYTVQVVPSSVKTKLTQRFDFGLHASKLISIALSFLVLLAITGINLLLVPLTGYWTIALIYLLFVTLYALFSVSIGKVIFAAASCALLWNFLFIPPLYTFVIGKLEDTLMYFMFFAIALVVGFLGSQLRLKETVLRNREHRITTLYELTKLIDSAGNLDELTEMVKNAVGEFLSARVTFYFTGELNIENDLPVPDLTNGSNNGDIMTILQWVIQNREPAGRFTRHFNQSLLYFLPVIGQTGVVAVMMIDAGSDKSIPIEQELFLQNILNQIALALDRETLVRRDKRNALIAESERLYKILFDSVSHEMRTPLTTITGASTSLLDPAVESNVKTRSQLINEIKQASERLNRVISNLLNLSRMESGMLTLTRRYYDLNELVELVLHKNKDLLADAKVTNNIPEGFPLLFMDFSLMEQVFSNLVNNVVVHAGPNVSLTISAEQAGDASIITVSDKGPGIPENIMAGLFNKPQNPDRRQSKGLGLGLVICKNIVEAHGGRIEAKNNPGSGACFMITFIHDSDKHKKDGLQ